MPVGNTNNDSGFTDVVALVTCKVSGNSQLAAPGDAHVGSERAARSHSATNHATGALQIAPFVSPLWKCLEVSLLRS